MTASSLGDPVEQRLVLQKKEIMTEGCYNQWNWAGLWNSHEDRFGKFNQ